MPSVKLTLVLQVLDGQNKGEVRMVSNITTYQELLTSRLGKRDHIRLKVKRLGNLLGSQLQEEGLLKD